MVCKTCGEGTEGSKCKTCRPLYEKDWRRMNPTLARLYNDRKKAATPKLTKDQLGMIEQIYATAKALTLSTGVEHHVDHIQPISRGGKHVPQNLQILTATENLRKSNKWDGPLSTYRKGAIKLTDAEILKMCQTLARKYKRSEDYDDLVSEGLVACYEVKAEGKSHKKDYVGAARRAMNDYMNISKKAMSIPNTWAARTVSHALATGEDLDKLEGVKSGTLRSLMDAMSNDSTPIEELEVAVPDHAVKYEKEEYEAYVMTVAVTTLNKDELRVLKGRFFDDMSLEELGIEFGVSESTVSRWEAAMLDKLRNNL